MSSTNRNINSNININKSTMDTILNIVLNAPLILVFSIFIFSLFSAALFKGLFYIFWILVITALRVFMIYIQIGSKPNQNKQITNPLCSSGIFYPDSAPTYSTYILSFSLAYFIVPMIIISQSQNVNAINYFVLLFFILYIIFDLFVKKYINCINSIFSLNVFSDLIGGFGLGSLISTLIYSSKIRNNLFINEIIVNKEICSKPSKQQFKCQIYKNGEIIG